jgi:hypothetical protein
MAGISGDSGQAAFSIGKSDLAGVLSSTLTPIPLYSDSIAVVRGSATMLAMEG